MKSLLRSITLAACALAGAGAHGATVYEQALDGRWLSDPTYIKRSFCSPCSALPNSRVFASFELDEDTVLEGARLAVIDNAMGRLGGFSVSVWAEPFGTGGPLFETLIDADDYERFTGSYGLIDILLPGWNLGSGSYWLSVMGVGGNYFQWGSDGTQGDDRRYNNGQVVKLADGSIRPHYVGFSLDGRAPVVAPVPVGGTLPLLAVGLLGLGLARRRR